MSSQIQITGGAKVRNLEGVLTGTAGIVSSVPLGAANGVATLDALGKVPLSQLPASVVTYLGTWNAATNTPTLANGTGDVGDLYICNVAGTVDFGSGPVTFAVGDWVIYSGTTWQKSSGQNGTVTSVAASITGNSVGITGSPITTAGTLAFAFAGTNLQYVNGAGNLTTFPTLISSIGLSMPSAFSVSNSPLTANGTIAVTGAGTASQYIRGDGALATFPATGGGGSAVYYYLNGSVNASVTGYKQMANTAVVGTGTDFSLVGNGLIAEFLTDAGNPNRLLIPAGAWNFEMYFSMSSSGGNQKFYVELLKYNGTTFTSIASNSTSPEEITGGTTTDLYLTSLGVPETTFLVTDRLALRIYIVDNSVGRTTTLHTEDNHLCQVTTTFSSGIAALNGLTANTQYFAVGTSGSDFNISSVLDTHTFNIPTASATKRGLLSSADWSTFNGKVPYTGANADVNLGSHLLTALGVSANSLVANGSSAPSGNSGYLFLKQGIAPFGNDSGYNSITANSTKFLFQADAGSSNNKIAFLDLSSLTNNTSRTYTLPDASGTISLTSDLSGYVPTSRTISTTSPLSGGGDLSANRTLSITQSSATVNGYLSSTDWSTFNGKQNALTNPITGTGTRTASYLPIFSAANTITNSNLFTLAGTLYIPQDVQVGYDGSSGNLQARAININNDSGGGLTLFKFGVGQTNALTTDGLGVSLVINGQTSSAFSSVLINPNTGSGNVIIGSAANAGYKLDVNGTFRATGAATFSSSIAGTSATFTLANDITLNARSGASGSFTYWSLGRTSSELEIGVAAASNQFFTGTAAGDVIIKANGSSNKLMLGYGSGSPTLTLASTGAATFLSSIAATSATFSGQVNIFNSAALRLSRFSTESSYYGDVAYTLGGLLLTSIEGYIKIGKGTAASPTTYLSIVDGGAATFSSNIFAGNTVLTSPSGADTIIGAFGGQDCSLILQDNVQLWELYVNDDFYINRGATTALSISRTSGAATFSSLGTGTVTATSGTLSTVSDMNLKNEDGFIDNALEKVLKLKPRYFHWKQESGLPTDLRQLGFYAQEVNEVLGEEAANTPKTENDKWGIYDRGMIAFLTAAIQELKQELDILKTNNI